MIITTGGDWWWIDAVTVNNKSYKFYNSEDIDLESDNYVIKQDCFVIERRDKNTLFIKLEENPSGVERVTSVTLQAGNYFDRVTIRRAPN